MKGHESLSGGNLTFSWICDSCRYSNQLKTKSRRLNSSRVIPISTAPAVDPAMIDLNALGYFSQPSTGFFLPRTR